MNKTLFSEYSSQTLKLAIYGAFSVICHLAAVTLYFLWHSESVPGALLVRTSSAMLEYSLMSAVIILVGALLIELVVRQAE